MKRYETHWNTVNTKQNERTLNVLVRWCKMSILVRMFMSSPYGPKKPEVERWKTPKVNSLDNSSKSRYVFTPMSSGLRWPGQTNHGFLAPCVLNLKQTEWLVWKPFVITVYTRTVAPYEGHGCFLLRQELKHLMVRHVAMMVVTYLLDFSWKSWREQRRRMLIHQSQKKLNLSSPYPVRKHIT